MMSFFSAPVCTPADPSFTSLFRLLDDFESYQQQAQGPRNNTNNGTQHRGRRAFVRALPSFSPKFDVRETDNTYELHGELPGLERDNVQIEFTEPQTLVVRGRIERTYERKPEPEAEQQDKPEPAEEELKQQRRNSHQATVEDDPEEPSTPTHTPPETPRTQVAKPANQEGKQVQKAPEEKYWAWERSVGEFSRTFNFPSRVEHEGVSASLENGILTVSVPKAKKHQVRRVAIN